MAAGVPFVGLLPEHILESDGSNPKLKTGTGKTSSHDPRPGKGVFYHRFRKNVMNAGIPQRFFFFFFSLERNFLPPRTPTFVLLDYELLPLSAESSI